MENHNVAKIADLLSKDRIEGVPNRITKPIMIEGSELKALLSEKGINLGDPLGRLVRDTEILCEALYSMNNGPLLMIFKADVEDELIRNLTGEESLGDLFFVQNCMVRLLRVPNETSLNILKKYCAALEI